jgi:hypothetical protein
MSLRSDLRNLRLRSWKERGLLVEACIWLSLARVATLLFPFRKAARWLGLSAESNPLDRQLQITTLDGVTTAAARQIGWALGVISNRGPGHSTCLVQALAGVAMLRRRNLAGTISLGVAKEKEAVGIVAHAWLSCGGEILTGAAVRERFTTITTFNLPVGNSRSRRGRSAPGNSRPNENIMYKILPLPALPNRFRLSPEFRLLAASSLVGRAFHGKSQAEKISSLCAGAIDWEAFISLVDRHQLQGLAYASLCRQLNLPEPVRERLKQRKVRTSARSLLYGAEVIRLSTAFTQHQIAAISLKGVLLSRRLFGDPGMRRIGDLDFMVQPQELSEADQLLKSAGYRRVFPNFEPTPKMRNWMLSQEHHMTYRHDGLQIWLDLHWRLDYWTKENVAELWAHRESTEWMGTTVQQLDDEALLLLLCSHGAGHRWSCVKWLSDVAALLTQDRSLDWERLIEMAARFDLRRTLAQTGLLVHWLYDIPLAEPLCELIRREPIAYELAGDALQVAQAKAQAPLPFGSIRILRHTLRLRRRLGLRAYLKRVLISAGDFKEFLLPDRFFWLHYPLRPLLWIKYHCLRKRTALT